MHGYISHYWNAEECAYTKMQCAYTKLEDDFHSYGSFSFLLPFSFEYRQNESNFYALDLDIEEWNTQMKT